MSFKAMATGGSDGNCSERRLENSGLNHRCIDYLPPVHHLSLFANHNSPHNIFFANPMVTIEGWKYFLEKWRWLWVCCLVVVTLPQRECLVDTSTWQAGAALLMLQRSAGSKVQSSLTNWPSLNQIQGTRYSKSTLLLHWNGFQDFKT